MGKQVGCWLANNLFTRQLLIGNTAKLLFYKFTNNLSTRQLLIGIAAKLLLSKLTNNLSTRQLLIGIATKLLLSKFANNLSTRQLVYSSTPKNPCLCNASKKPLLIDSLSFFV